LQKVFGAFLTRNRITQVDDASKSNQLPGEMTMEASSTPFDRTTTDGAGPAGDAA